MYNAQLLTSLPYRIERLYLKQSCWSKPSRVSSLLGYAACSLKWRASCDKGIVLYKKLRRVFLWSNRLRSASLCFISDKENIYSRWFLEKISEVEFSNGLLLPELGDMQSCSALFSDKIFVLPWELRSFVFDVSLSMRNSPFLCLPWQQELLNAILRETAFLQHL